MFKKRDARGEIESFGSVLIEKRSKKWMRRERTVKGPMTRTTVTCTVGGSIVGFPPISVSRSTS